MAKWEAVQSTEDGQGVVISGYDLLQDGDYVGFVPGHIAIEIARKLNAFDEMLAALKGIESTYVFLDSLTSGIEPQHSNTMLALSRIRAAIAKAEAANV